MRARRVSTPEPGGLRVKGATIRDAERTYLRLMLERRVEGLIVAVPRLRIADDDILADAVVRIPTVLVASDIELAGADHVDIDNRRGGHEATGYLLAQRHRVIATI